MEERTTSLNAARRDFFNAAAGKWGALLSAENEAFLLSVLHRLDTPPLAGKRVLDLGCGAGVLFPLYAGWKITACDISEMMLERARENAPKNVVEFVRADAHDLPFEDAAFARVAMFSMLPHAEDPDRVLREAFRVLKPGGTLSVVHLESAGRISQIHERLGGAVANDKLPPLSVLVGTLSDIGYLVEYAEDEPRYVALCRKPA